MSVILLETIPESASAQNQLFEAAPAKNALTAKAPRKMAESLPLARIGRAYGNDISKLNLMKPLARRSSEYEVREPWHSSSKTDTREYGDYYSWQARLTYLEVNRFSIIASKGVKHFVDEYMKKLLKCEIFERGHNVELFASVRQEILDRGNNSSSLKNDVVQDSRDSFGINRYRKNAKSAKIPASALKTIELIRKYRSGQSIDALLRVNKEVNIASVHDVDNSGTITLKNPSRSVQSQKIISTSNIMTKGKNLNTTTNRSSLTKNQKSPSKQSRNSNLEAVAGPSKLGSSTMLTTSLQKQQQIQKRKSLDKKNVRADKENREHEDSKSSFTSNRNLSRQNQKKSSSTVLKSSKTGSIISHSATVNNKEIPPNYEENTDPSTITGDITTKLNTTGDRRSKSGSRFNIFGRHRNSDKNGQNPTDSTVSHSSTTKNDPEHNENAQPTITNSEQETTDVPVVDDAVQNLLQNIEKEEERGNVPQKSHFSTNRATLYRKYDAEQAEKATDDNISVEEKSMQSVGSFDRDKFVESEKALYPRMGSILSEYKSNE
ncbi:uncharacterized protein LOC119075954 [Bradysia coprophila]|uniref:uncharacterized protein LOC119075954 n=1 Tax=Bradysia coprophila TaxID=38358 RepID=UPI00187D8AB5|nr:uncharacterized protein LOC119075954 [Bradysia coprophila]